MALIFATEMAGSRAVNRSAAVAGSWYPDHPSHLAADIDRYLGERDRWNRHPVRHVPWSPLTPG